MSARARTIAARTTMCAALLLILGGGAPSVADDLGGDLGRNDVRVRSAPYRLIEGVTVSGCALVERLERLGYERVGERPTRPGSYFWGNEVLWIDRRAHRRAGRRVPARLIGLRLAREDGRILGAVDANGRRRPLRSVADAWLEPETLAESLDGRRARREPVALDELPEVAWRALLAAEDARFFDHLGLDARGIARAALADLRSGGVEQGGSTITQQLVKMRDLSPKRTVGRKASEAVRALALEAEYDKREILEAYLDEVYYGHVDGLAVHGIGTAARVFFSEPASRLDLARSALLAALVQGPNRLSPLRHPDEARRRRDWVLGRMAELGWADAEQVAAARRAPLGLRPSAPHPEAARRFVGWIAELARAAAPQRVEEGRGVVVETTLDPWLQAQAETIVADWLARLRRDHTRLRDAGLSAALVALDADDGAVLAYVGGDPADRDDRFDRARLARRQPGSAIKPLILLEALDDCGVRDPLSPATRVADEPLTIELPSGPWTPRDFDGRFEGVIDLRRALAESRNVPFVRVARWCGLEAVGRRMERAGIELPDELPPSLALGAVETTPLRLAGAYTALATPGRAWRPWPARRIEKPSGRRIDRERPDGRRVADPAAAWLARDMMRTAVERGTATVADLAGVDVAAKTGSSSELRDAWFAGDARGIVAVVWIGLDDGTPLGLTGAAAAGPPWRRFVERAAAGRPPRPLPPPPGVVRARIDPATGLRVGPGRRGAVEEWFRRSGLPRRDRFWRVDREGPVVR